MQKTYIIAEAGVNHNGSIENALRLIDVAVEAGADAVKFQTFLASAIVSKNAPKADYQNKTTNEKESQFEMLKKLELSEESHKELIQYAKKKDIEFLSTPFDLQSLHLLTKTFNLKTIKIPSGEITNAPFLLEIAQCADKIILSTGMSTISDIEMALGVLAFGFLKKDHINPSLEAFAESFASEDGQRQLQERVILLHATTEYPAPFNEINLNALDTMRVVFGLPVGYSDHSQGIHLPVAAVAKGAVVIEKHFGELKLMVQVIRDIEKALGDGIKRPTESELKNRTIARKSLVAIKPISKGELFSVDNIGCKRPGNGVMPSRYWEYLGKMANDTYSVDDLLL